MTFSMRACWYLYFAQNERLMQEQSVYLKNLLKQAKEYDKKVAEEREIDKTEVVTVMMDKWEAAKVQEKEVASEKSDSYCCLNFKQSINFKRSPA